MKKVLIALLICLSVVTLFVACSSSPKKKCGIEVAITYGSTAKDNHPDKMDLRGYITKIDDRTFLAEDVVMPATDGTIKIDLPAGSYTGLILESDPFYGDIFPSTRELSTIIVEEGKYTACECIVAAD